MRSALLQTSTAIGIACVLVLAGPADLAAASSAIDGPVFARIDAAYQSGAVTAGLARADSMVAVARASRDAKLESAALVYRAIGLNWSRRFPEALAVVDGRMPTIRAQRDAGCLATAHLARAYALQALVRPGESRRALERAASIAATAGRTREVAYARLRLGWNWLQAGQSGDAAREYRAALKAANVAGLASISATAHVGLGNALNELGDALGAQREYYAAVRQARAAGALVDEADALFNLGILRLRAGDLARGAPLMRGAAETYRRLRRTEKVLGATRTLAIAEMLQGHFVTADTLLESTMRELGNRADPATRGRLLAQQARVRVLMRRYGEARTLARAALVLADSALVAERCEIVTSVALVYDHSGSPDSAVAILHEQRARADVGNSGRYRAQLDLGLAAPLLHLQRPREAIEVLRASLESSDRLGFAPMMRAQAAAQLACAQRELGKPDSAAAWFERALELWEHDRRTINAANWREVYDSPSPTMSHGYILLLLDTPSFGTRATRVERAFGVLQRHRGRTFTERRTKRDIVNPPISCERFRRRTLQPGEVFLDLHYTRDTMIVFAVSRDSAVAWPARGTDDLAPRMRRLREALEDPSPSHAELVRASGVELGRELLGPGAGMIARARTVIVAGGGLGLMPWGALVLPGESEPMQVRRVVAHSPSATLLDELRSDAATRAPGRGVFVAACAHDDEGRPLAGVAREARGVAAAWKDARVLRDRAIGGAAGLLAGATNADVVHVAAHARSNSDDGWTSAVLLGDANHPGDWLDAATLAAANTRARLCVTSACGSVGFISNESLQGLAGAWLAAGARCAVAMQPRADDESSAELMTRFHRALAAGLPAGEALRRAQREVRDMPQYAAPSYWSGAVLVGDPSVRVAFPPTHRNGR